MNKVKVLSGIIIVLLVSLSAGFVVFYNKIVELENSVNTLYSQMYSPQDDSQVSDENSPKVEELEAKISELEYEISKVKTEVGDVESKNKQAEDKFYSLCMLHNICDL